jgi:5'-phosphate synthase pdxT subunit
MKIGILAVQGDFEAHARMLTRLGAECVYVRTPADLQGVDGIVLPGGESTTQWKFLEVEGLRPALEDFVSRGGAAFGTCAGAILMAKEVRNPEQPSLGLADLTVIRNAYGRQLSSEVIHEASRLGESPLEMVFIRAPIIERVGEGWEILAERDGHPVLARNGRTLVATFHPELTEDTRVHAYFLKLVGNGANP